MRAAETTSAQQANFFEDWIVTCLAESKEDCRLWQKVQVDFGTVRQDVMVVSVAPQSGAETPVFVVQTPLDVFLPAGFGLDVDGLFVTTAPFRSCDAAGCWVIIPATFDLVQRLQRGAAGHAIFQLVEGQTIRISFSLRGFTAAWEAFQDALG